MDEDYLDDPLVYTTNQDDYQYTTTDPGYSIWGADDPTGFQTIRYDDGSTLIVDNQGNPIGSTQAPDSATPGFAQTISNLVARGGQSAYNAIKGMFTKPGTNETDWRAVATTIGGIGGLLNLGGASQRPTGYQGKIPQYTAVRQAVQPQYDPNRRPGSSGMRYFTDVQYATPDNVSAAQTASTEQAQGLATLNAQNPAREQQPAATLAGGGIVNLQPGGFVLPADVVSHVGNGSSDAGMRTLQSRLGAQPILGRGDGMSDSNRTTIAGQQPAAVAHEEMYLQPRQVQQLGGPERLYAMMDNIRKARTGTTKQGRQINPDQFLPRQA